MGALSVGVCVRLVDLDGRIRVVRGSIVAGRIHRIELGRGREREQVVCQTQPNMDSNPPLVKLGFSLKQKSKTNASAPQYPAATPFLSFDDDEPRTGEPAKPGGRLVATEALMSKSLRKQLEEQKKVDPHAFEYDEVWDRMKDAERQAQLAMEEEAKVRKVRLYSFVWLTLY